MQAQSSRQKISHLQSCCTGVNVAPGTGPLRAARPPLSRVLVSSTGPCDADASLERTFVGGQGASWGLVTIRRAAFERGVEVVYDGRSNYINKICRLAVSPGSPRALPRALVAKALLTMGGDRLFIVDVGDDEAAQLFTDLSFSRISRFKGCTRYGYLMKMPAGPANPRQAELNLSGSHYAARMSEGERRYHQYLKARTGFDMVQLVQQGATCYHAHGNNLVFVLTWGLTGNPSKTAFHLDLFHMRNGAIIGYIDVAISSESNYALTDEAITDFCSPRPHADSEALHNVTALDRERSRELRAGWPPREGLWVRCDHRRAGIGQALVRVAGDLCKLCFADIASLGVIFPWDNPWAYAFHKKAGAQDTNDPLYCLEYRLNADCRPRITILHGL